MSDRLERFAGRVAIVTGGAAGIGHAPRGPTRRRARGRDRRPRRGPARAAAAALGVDSLAADLTREDDVAAWSRPRSSGTAGSTSSSTSPGSTRSRAIEMRRSRVGGACSTVNLDATFLCRSTRSRTCASAATGGSSTRPRGPSTTGQPGLAAYVATKAGVIGLSRVLSKEAGADGVTVNVIMPGLIATERALGTFGDAGEADAGRLLADAIEHQSIKRTRRARGHRARDPVPQRGGLGVDQRPDAAGRRRLELHLTSA